MSGFEDATAPTCSGCDAALVTNARFCAHCGLATKRTDDPIPVLDHRSMETNDTTASTRERAHRNGVPEWLAVMGGVAAVLAVWFVISRPGSEVRAAEAERAEQEAAVERSEEMLDADQLMPSFPSATADTSTDLLTTNPDSSDEPTESTSTPSPPAAPASDEGAPLEALDANGWRLLAGDGFTIVDVDLGSGEQERIDGVGAPLAVVDGRLLVYRDSRLAWSSPDDLGASGEEIVEVPALQRMFTRGRSADRPVVVDADSDPSIWWPNNNANPQTWTMLRLADGTVLDSISLAETVFGGPEVVATVGSGTFERVDGRWAAIGDLFASSASAEAIVGQRCARPDVCDWVLQSRNEGQRASSVEQLDIPVGGPFDLRLVTDADRVLLLESDGVTDYETGRSVPFVAANAPTLTATNRGRLLAMADGAGLGPRSSIVTVVDLDGAVDASVSRITVADLIPRWLVLLPPR